jgi:hypothetical protein
LCKYIQKHFPKPVKAFGVQTVEPGEVVEIDFGYLGMLSALLPPGVGSNLEGKLIKAWGLVMVLSYSRKLYAQITYDQKLGSLVAAVKNGFEFFGGVPKRTKVDNMKTAIAKNQHYDLEFNQDFLEFTNHYGTAILPCAPYHPEQKGKVESGVKYLESNFLKGRDFTDGNDLKKQLRDWVVNVANQRKHGITKKIPEVVFQTKEKDALQPLPAEEFAFFNRGVRKAQANCHVHFENNYYSVPSCLVGREVTVRWNERIIRIIYQGEQVALHKLNQQSQGEYITVRSHLPDYKTYSQTEYQAKYEEKMADIGEHAHQYFKQILENNPNYWSRTVRGILGLVKQYGKQAVDMSLKRAHYYRVTDLVTIRNICEKRLYLHEVEPRLPAQLAMGQPPPDSAGQSSWWSQWVVKLLGESHTKLTSNQWQFIKPKNSNEHQRQNSQMSRELSYYSPSP